MKYGYTIFLDNGEFIAEGGFETSADAVEAMSLNWDYIEGPVDFEIWEEE